VLCARQGVSASASRASAGRLAGQVSGHLMPVPAGDHARIALNFWKLIPVVTFVTSVRDLGNPGVPRETRDFGSSDTATSPARESMAGEGYRR